MTPSTSVDKLTLNQLVDPPRMVGDADVALVRKLAGEMPAGTRILEIGPWLGGVTRVLADFGPIDVVDRFEWTDLNAEAYPGLASPGASFRPLFERIMAENGIHATVHETDYRDFDWTGAPLGLCFVDAPRRAEDLVKCLKSFASSLADDAIVMIKNGLNLAHVEMAALLEILVGREFFRMEQTDQPRWCNIAVLRPGPGIGDLDAFDITPETFSQAPVAPDAIDPWGGALLTISRLAQQVSEAGLPAGLRMLRALPRNTDIAYAWDQAEEQIDAQQMDDVSKAVFAELLAAQTNDLPRKLTPSLSLAWTLRHWWANNRDQPWQVEGFDATLIEAAFEAGSMEPPGRLGIDLKGLAVVEIGRNLGLSGIGYVTAGVRSYVGWELDRLSREMVRAEIALEPISYSPIESASVESGANAHLFILRDDATLDSSALRVLKDCSAARNDGEGDMRVLALPREGGLARPFRW